MFIIIIIIGIIIIIITHKNPIKKKKNEVKIAWKFLKSFFTPTKFFNCSQ